MPLTLYVKRFSSDEMKMIKTFIPWSEFFPVKLLSSKVKELMELVEDKGAPGQYKRKTYVVKSGDTLEGVAQANGTSVGALATLNDIAADSMIDVQKQRLRFPHIESDMKEFRLMLLAILSLIATFVLADDIDGTWKFEKAVDYEGLSQNIDPPPELGTIQIANAKILLSSRCHVSLKKWVDRLDVPFQTMFKVTDLNTEKIGEYLNNEFGFKLTDVSYSTDLHMSDCNRFGQHFLVSKDRIMVISAGTIFLSYKRSDGGTSAASRSAVPLYGHKLSHLPYNQKNFKGLCAGVIPRGKKGPLTTTKCAPVYFPYAVYEKDKDPLSVLIGTHEYLARGSQTNNAEDYDDPLSNGLHPVFMLLPPLGDVLLVRVEDLQGGEVRDGIGGVFLSIKNGRVVDQLNDDCNWDERYYCGYEGKKQPRYQLLESGKFKELK